MMPLKKTDIPEIACRKQREVFQDWALYHKGWNLKRLKKWRKICKEYWKLACGMKGPKT